MHSTAETMTAVSAIYRLASGRGALSAKIRADCRSSSGPSKVEFYRSVIPTASNFAHAFPLEPGLFLLVVRASLDLLLLLCWSLLLDIGWGQRTMCAFNCFCLFNQTGRVKPQRLSRLFVRNGAS